MKTEVARALLSVQPLSFLIPHGIHIDFLCEPNMKSMLIIFKIVKFGVYLRVSRVIM